jgi:KRAB domain-containing zinc finger protein
MDASFESCCRLCLTDNATLIEIFQLQNDSTIVDMIKEICNVEIEEDDALPKEVCAECLDVITAAYSLRAKSQNNDRLLRGEFDEELKEEIIDYEPDEAEEAYEVVEIGYMVDSTDSQSFICDKCSEVKGSKEEIKQHILENHMHVCHLCDKQCKTEFSLRNHIHRMHNDERLAVFTCEYCKAAFKTHKKLEKHKTIHNYYDEIIGGNSKVNYKCRVEGCAKSFDSYSEKLFTHIKIHEKGEQLADTVETFICPHCGNCYKSKQILQQHIKRHFDTGEKYPCQNCPQKFKSW